MEFTVGALLEGKVKSITKFGAFITLPENRTGMVHISEVANTYVSDIHDHLTEGQDVKVKVIGIDQAGRINLSIKQVAPPPPRPARQGGGQQRFGGGGRPPRQGGGSRPMGFVRQAPKEPTDFEDRLKQFMQASDSKLSELRYIEKKGGNRRSGGGGRR